MDKKTVISGVAGAVASSIIAAVSSSIIHAGSASESVADSGTPAYVSPSHTVQYFTCVNKYGTGAQKALSKHVTKVFDGTKFAVGADSIINTDFTGEYSSDSSNAGLIATAFMNCHTSGAKNSHILVYSKSNQMLSSVLY